MARGFASVMLSFRAAIPAILLAAPPAFAADAPRQRDLPRERAEWNLLFRKDARGRVLPENRLKALREACDVPVDPSMVPDPAGTYSRSDVGPSVPALRTFGGTAWQSIGPTPINPLPTSIYAWTSASGRIDALAVHPTNPSNMLLGSATGGIWKSTDAGSTWRPVSDTAPASAISSIAYSRANPNVVYAATGEADNAGWEGKPSTALGMYLGAGVLKSLDGGESWTRIDTNLPGNAVLSRVIPHPTDVNQVLVGVVIYQDVAADTSYVGGLYRSTDGGVTFARTLTHRVTDLAQDPVSPDKVYLATGGCGNCGFSGVYASTDFGRTWGGSWGYAQGTTIGNTKLSVSATNPVWVYASFLKSDNVHDSISRSTDGGASWQDFNAEPTMCPAAGGDFNNQCGYDHFISADPSNPSTVYFGSINMYRSDDAARTWTRITPFYDGGYAGTIHPDQHAGLFLPSGAFLVGNDGGLFQTANGGLTWTSLGATLTISQFNTISLHPTNASTAIGGTQDNGSPFYKGTLTWDDRTAGDGGNPLIRQDDPREVFGPHYFAGFSASTDGGATFKSVAPCNTLMNCQSGDPLDMMAFYAPTAAAPSSPRTLFVGTNRIWANATFGTNPSAWQPRSSGKITNNFFTTIDVAGDGSGPIWAGSSGRGH